MRQIKTLLSIAWRNVFRNRRRTLLTLSILAIGCVGLVLIGGYFDNVLEGMREQMIHSQYGHLQVNASGYYQKGVTAPYDYLIRDVARAEAEIEKTPHVLFTVPRLKISGMASSETTTVAVVALGTDHIRETRMGSAKALNVTIPSIHILEGRDLDESDPYGVLVGKGLLKSLGLKLGDTINFLTTREAGALDGAPFRVRGVFETIVKDADDRSMKVNLGVLQKIAGVPNQLHTLMVVLDDTKNVDEVKSDLSRRLQAARLPLETLTWNEVDTVYRQYDALHQKICLIVQMIICVVFFFSVANTVNMALMERIREFGTMMAIGNGRGSVFGMIFMEVFLFAVVGSLIGVLAGCVVARIVSSIGIEMPPPPLGTNSYTAMITLSWPLLIQSYFISMISTLLSGILPAYRGCHFRIIEALGYV